MSARDASTPGGEKPLQKRGDERVIVLAEGRLLGSFSEMLIMLGGCLVFSVVGAWLIEGGHLWGWAVLAPFAVGALLTMFMALIPVPLLRAGPIGVAVRGSLRPARWVAWDNAVHFRPAPDGRREIHYDYLGTEPGPGLSDPFFTPFVPGRIDLRGSHADPGEIARVIEEHRPG